MSKIIRKFREERKPRSIETLCALFHCKGTFMRAKQDRRAKERKNDWRKSID